MSTRIFISYSHRGNGRVWRDRLVRHIGAFFKHDILDGSEDYPMWHGDLKARIVQAMESTSVAIILLSHEALESKSMANFELTFFSERWKQETFPVFWVVCEPCEWRESEASKWLHAIQSPTGAEPLSSFTDSVADRRLRDVATAVAKEMVRIELRALESSIKTVLKARQTISFPPLPDKSYDTPPFAVTAQTSSGLPLSFNVIAGPARIDGNIVSLSGPGQVTIRASQSGDANYEAAEDVIRSFEVHQRVLPESKVLTSMAGWYRRFLSRLRFRYQSRDGTKSSPAGRGPTPEVPGGTADRVHFSVTSSHSMAPGSRHVVDIWAHLEGQRQEVIARTREASVGRDVFIKSKGPVKITKGTVITVRLCLPGLVVEPPEDTILWEGEIGNAQFSVQVANSAAIGWCQGHAVFLIDGFPISRLLFEIQIASSNAAPDTLVAKVQRYRSVFASYASQDSDAVLARIQGLRKGRPDIDIFFAEAHIRPGEPWQERLLKEIITRDALYLFWSQAASESPNVEWEWRSALKEHGIDFIDPVPLAHPKEVPPPTELSALHFNDWVLAYFSGQPSDAGSSDTTN